MPEKLYSPSNDNIESLDLPGTLALIANHSDDLSHTMNVINVANSNSQEMTDKLSVSDVILGISLSEELNNNKLNSTDNSNQWKLILGVIVLEKLTLNAEELRRFMCSQIPSLPASFLFLTKEGWPVMKNQERLIKIIHLINEKNIVAIKKQFEKLRVGVITYSGECLGFIFVDMNSNLSQVREAVNNQLKNEANVIKYEYKFMERNGWPVLTMQESFLTLMDILIGQSFCIQYDNKMGVSYSKPLHSAILSSTTNEMYIQPSSNQDNVDGDGVGRKPSWKLGKIDFRSISVRRGKDYRRGFTGKELVAKPILLSYVRAEAAQYALQLKNELCTLGFSVYLDVHEIKTGSDWQDALNFAVRHCYIFVPLITPMYGKTQWTNREVKLADTLGKLIIPVNFTDQWPPECLAIQFASTQYIPYRLLDNEHEKIESEKVVNMRSWEPEFVKRVADEIALHFQRDQACKISEKKISTRSYDATPLSSSVKNPPKVERSEENRLIVISVHPKQRILAKELKATFTKYGYQVWCSVETSDSHTKTASESEGGFQNPLTPRELPTIPEGEVFFSQTGGESFVSIGESKQFSSVFRHEGHRPLSRLLSQLSDISQVSSLTPEKLDRLKLFQQKTDQAGVVIVVVSDSYTKSKTSQQQVFYCEHRKKVVLLKYDNCQIPAWFTQLMGNDMITYLGNTQFELALRAKVKRALNPAYSETSKEATAEAKMQFLITFMKKNLPQIDECVYITGSSKLQNPRSEKICRAIARELAKVKNIGVVTGGFLGSADILAKTFYELKAANMSSNPQYSPVVHILPTKDSQDFTSKANQHPDGSFEIISYGKTMFLGDSVKERESAVARLFDTCILVEGGPGAAREVEEFIWNDHFVIPIISTGCAAGGQYGVPVKIFETPPPVSPEDWSVLSEKDASPDDVAKAVVNIIVALKRSIASHSRSNVNTQINSSKSKRKSKTCKGKDKENDPNTKNSKFFPKQNLSPSVPSRELLVPNDGECSQIVKPRHAKWWQRFIHVFSK
ncbi:uncharacterized protein [Centruroides vittatus]|uniref:uncharacterized protein isoform X2 n=1 Tax=Centruroides vittatus TaxID=120091 RepID=UPI00350EBCFC